MSFGSQPLAQGGNQFASPVAICAGVSILLLLGLLGAFGVPLVVCALVVGTASFVWLAFRYPLGVLGTALAFMPVFPMAFLLAKFFGPSFIGNLEGLDRVVLLVLVLALWWRNGIKLATPDWFLLACFGLALLRLAFDGRLLPLLSDFNFIIAYAVGRVAVLTIERQNIWARRAVWIVGVLAVLGMVEVFVIGQGPRTVLYLSVSPELTEDGQLGGPFHAIGYEGLRESSTMLGALHFAPLCMAALIIWWVYFRNPLPGAMIAAGLICTVTRSAWVGTGLALPFLATVMGEAKRFSRYLPLALALFGASIPILGLSDYLFSIKSREDPSAEEHASEIHDAVYYALEHPLGVGPGKAGRWATDKYNDANAFFVDDTYLTFATEYGILAALCFVGFLLSALWLSWHERTLLGYAAAGILVGFGAEMIFFIAHDVFPLACWIWFPVGMAVRSATTSGIR